MRFFGRVFRKCATNFCEFFLFFRAHAIEEALSDSEKTEDARPKREQNKRRRVRASSGIGSEMMRNITNLSKFDKALQIYVNMLSIMTFGKIVLDFFTKNIA